MCCGRGTRHRFRCGVPALAQKQLRRHPSKRLMRSIVEALHAEDDGIPSPDRSATISTQRPIPPSERRAIVGQTFTSFPRMVKPMHIGRDEDESQQPSNDCGTRTLLWSMNPVVVATSCEMKTASGGAPTSQMIPSAIALVKMDSTG
jgi:hypothetical protein